MVPLATMTGSVSAFARIRLFAVTPPNLRIKSDYSCFRESQADAAFHHTVGPSMPSAVSAGRKRQVGTETEI